MSGMQIFVKTLKATPLSPHSGTARQVWKAPAGTEATVFGLAPDTRGFRATDEVELVDGLPTDVNLPAELLEVLALAREVEAWIDTGRRVRAWAEEEGEGDASWLDEGVEPPAVAVPPALAKEELPTGVVRWVLHSDEIGPAVHRLLRAADDAG